KREPGAAEEDQRQKLVQKLGENITIRRFKRLQAKGKLALYVHAGAKIGVLAEMVERERSIHLARAKESGKPEEIARKMVEGSLNKFLGEISLLGQPFIKDDKQTIEKMLAA